MPKELQIPLQIVGALASLIAILQAGRVLLHGHRIRVSRIDGASNPVQQTGGEIDLRTGNLVPAWVYALRFGLHVQNDGSRKAPRVSCVYAVDEARPARSMTELTTCQNIESIIAGARSDAFIIECQVQGRLPPPVNLDVHVLGFLLPRNGRICRFDASLFRNSLGEESVSGRGETVGWIQSDIIRIAVKWRKRGNGRLGLWLARKAKVEQSLLQSMAS